MNRITQKTSNDCGVACIAMIINKYANCPHSNAYEVARKALFNSKTVNYTKVKELRSALTRFGIELGRRRYRFKQISSTDMGLDFDAIISTKPNHNGYWHWMVWDASQRQLLDPNPKKKGFGHRSAYHYLKVSSKHKC